MKAVLMAGGSGTRLRPLTCDIPKPMVPMLNRPMAEHIIGLLKRHGITEILVTLYYLPQVIQNYFGDGRDFGVRITYSVEEKMPLGTAGSVKAIESFLDDTFIVISGDSLTDLDLTAAVEYHRRKQAQATLVLHRVENPLEFGVVITDDEGRIERFLEKPSSSEVFSDTINTGIYILEPEVLSLLEPDREFDFSKDLFPMLLHRRDPLYGYIAEGYWEDVGNLQAYRQAHYDILEGKVKIDMPYPEREPGIYVGEGTVIHPSARLSGPLVIGNHCQIGEKASLSPGTVLGDNVIVRAGGSLKRPVVWQNAYLGEHIELRGCVIGKNTGVKRGAEVLEGAIVANDCIVGESAILKPNVKVWPNKTIETGATVTASLIWGASAQRTLFGASGVRGLANIEISPEFAVKLGASYGATLPPGSSVAVSRDGSQAARMINRGLISGLMSVGINVVNLEMAAMPVARFQVPTLGVQGGVHIRISPEHPDLCQIEFLDRGGLNISKATEKKIEANYFKEDFRRVQISEIGDISFPARAAEYYKQGFRQAVTMPTARTGRKLKIVLDYAFSIANPMLPGILGELDIESVVLNAHLRPVMPNAEERGVLIEQLAEVTQALRADFGVQIDANGERVTVVDERGRILQGERLTATLTHLFLSASPGKVVAVPVTASEVVERIAEQHGGRVIRTKANPRALMEVAHQEKVLFAGTEGTFIFPVLHPGFDGMLGVAKIAEALLVLGKSLAQVEQELPDFHHLHDAVECPWEHKGTVMRRLVEGNKDRTIELLDGVKIRHGQDWVLVLPDPVEPLIHVYADARSAIGAERLVEEMGGTIREVAAGKEEVVGV
ncbi:MAG: mannose-1-phosphate guanyltransferase [bacterium]|nr:mannose-1-phosphate guanyltransferase [bacterium]